MKSVLATFLLAASFLAFSRAGTQLSSSAILFYGEEYEPAGSSRCTSILQEAAKHGSKRVNIVPTLYFVGQSTEGTPGVCNPDNWRLNVELEYFCQYPTYTSACVALDPESIARFQVGFQACLQDAVNLGFTEVLISPHLDDGTKTEHWRNMLLFDPLQAESSGNSYWGIMLQPILQAATAVAFPSTTEDNSNTTTTTSSSSSSGPSAKSIWISLQGEMGCTLWTAPASYQQIVQDMKSAWAEAQQSWQGSRPAGSAADSTLLLGALFSAANVAGRSFTTEELGPELL
jgi:hypothetical protein